MQKKDVVYLSIICLLLFLGLWIGYLFYELIENRIVTKMYEMESKEESHFIVDLLTDELLSETGLYIQPFLRMIWSPYQQDTDRNSLEITLINNDIANHTFSFFLSTNHSSVIDVTNFDLENYPEQYAQSYVTNSYIINDTIFPVKSIILYEQDGEFNELSKRKTILPQESFLMKPKEMKKAVLVIGNDYPYHLGNQFSVIHVIRDQQEYKTRQVVISSIPNNFFNTMRKLETREVWKKLVNRGQLP